MTDDGVDAITVANEALFTAHCMLTCLLTPLPQSLTVHHPSMAPMRCAPLNAPLCQQTAWLYSCELTWRAAIITGVVPVSDDAADAAAPRPIRYLASSAWPCRTATCSGRRSPCASRAVRRMSVRVWVRVNSVVQIERELPAVVTTGDSRTTSQRQQLKSRKAHTVRLSHLQRNVLERRFDTPWRGFVSLQLLPPWSMCMLLQRASLIVLVAKQAKDVRAGGTWGVTDLARGVHLRRRLFKRSGHITDRSCLHGQQQTLGHASPGSSVPLNGKR